MKNVCILFFLILCNVASAQIINFPDSNFKNALVNTKCVDTNDDSSPDADVDLNNDGEIDVSEALMVTNLRLNNIYISNVSGLEEFRNLEELYFGFQIDVKNYDFAVHAKLELLEFVNYGNSYVLKNCKSLNDLKVTIFNNCIKLEIQNNPKLSKLNIEGDNFNGSKFDTLIAKNNALNIIEIYTLRWSNNNTYLDLSFNEFKNGLSVIYNLPVKSVNLSNNKLIELKESWSGVEKLDISNNKLTYLNNDLRNCESLNLKGNPIVEIYISNIKNFNLTSSVNSVKKINISNFEKINLDSLPFLEEIIVEENYFSDTLVLKHPNLKKLIFNCNSGSVIMDGTNKIENIITGISKDLFFHAKLVEIRNNSNLKNIDFSNSGVSNLTIVECDSLKNIKIDLSSFYPNELYMDISLKKLKAIDTFYLRGTGLDFEIDSCVVNNLTFTGMDYRQYKTLVGKISNNSNVYNCEFSYINFESYKLNNLINSMNSLKSFKFFKCILDSLQFRDHLKLEKIEINHVVNHYLNINNCLSIDTFKIINLFDNRIFKVEECKIAKFINDESGFGDTYFRNIKDLDTITINAKFDSKKIHLESLSSLKSLNLKSLPNEAQNIPHKVSLNLLVLPDLEEFRITGFSLDSFVFERFFNLRKLIISGNSISSLLLDSLPNLEYLDCRFNNLEKLNVTIFPNLKSLYCSKNKLEELNLLKTTKIEFLDCAANYLRELNVSSMHKLNTLYCYSNDMRVMNLKNGSNAQYSFFQILT